MLKQEQANLLNSIIGSEYLYPIINASDDNDVASALMKICKDKELSLNMGKESKQWFNKYVIGEGLQKIINAIES